MTVSDITEFNHSLSKTEWSTGVYFMYAGRYANDLEGIREILRYGAAGDVVIFRAFDSTFYDMGYLAWNDAKKKLGVQTQEEEPREEPRAWKPSDDLF